MNLYMLSCPPVWHNCSKFFTTSSCPWRPTTNFQSAVTVISRFSIFISLYIFQLIFFIRAQWPNFFPSSLKYLSKSFRMCAQALKGGPEPIQKEINEILGSKREDRLSDPFFELVQNNTLVRFSYQLRLCKFCKAPRDMRNFPQKCQKIAGCWWRAVYIHNFRSLGHLAHPLRNDQV